jgi:hypothetical protein
MDLQWDLEQLERVRAGEENLLQGINLLEER